MFTKNLLKLGRGFYRPNKTTFSRYTASRAKTKFKDGGEHATFNDVPIPQGCWKEANARRQSRYNMVLLSGLGAFVGSVIFVSGG